MKAMQNGRKFLARPRLTDELDQRASSRGVDVVDQARRLLTFCQYSVFNFFAVRENDLHFDDLQVWKHC